MLMNEWQHLGEDIRDIVQSAVDSQDFDKLNQTIRSVVNGTIKGLHESIRDAGDVFGRGSVQDSADDRRSRMQNQRETKSQEPAYGKLQPGIRRSSELFANINGQKMLGIMLMILGYTGLTVFGFIVLALILGIGISGWFFGAGLSLGMMAALFAGCICLAAKGSRTVSMTKRFEKYIRGLRGRTYGDVKELALEVGKKEDFVKKDLTRMIDKGWFREGHLDPKKTCLMITNQVFEEYLSAVRRSEELRLRELAEEQKARERGVSAEVQAVIEEGNAYISKIRQSNDAIPGEEISAKIYLMEELVKRIFERVEQHPENINDIHKLMEYYLPTTVKLLGAYEELDRQPIQGENILHSKKEIEDTLDTLNLAFEKLLDGLFKDTAWDVSTDISVLHTMLAQEGLGKDDF